MLQSSLLRIAPGAGKPPLEDEVYWRLIHEYRDPTDGILAAHTVAQGILILLRGRGQLIVDGEPRNLRRGDCIRQAPGMHLAWHQTHPGVHLLRATVKGQRAERVLDAVGLRVGEVVASPPRLVADLIERISDLHAHGAGTYDGVALAWLFFAGFAPRQIVEPDLVDSCLELIHERAGQDLGIGALARGLGVSRSTLFRQFQTRFGISPKVWLDDYRLQRAADLLTRSSEAVVVIARSCGFTDLSWFGRRFRDRFGDSPGRWRHQRRRSAHRPAHRKAIPAVT